MARLTVFFNPLDVSRRRRHNVPDGVSLLDWIDEHEPTPRNATRHVMLDGETVTSREVFTQADDDVLVRFAPGAVVVPYIVQALVSLAISYVVSQIFKPKKPTAANIPAPSQVYGIAPPRNAARLGEPIPVVYGEVITTPDYAAQPYSEFINGEQFVYAILCIGQGEHDVSEILLANSSLQGLPDGVAKSWVYQPGTHQSVFGNIQSQTGVLENVVTSASVADQELLAKNVVSTSTPPTWYWSASAQENWVIGSTVPPGAVNLIGITANDDRYRALPQAPVLGTVVPAIIASGAGANVTGLYYTATPYIAGTTVPPAQSVIPPNGYDTIGTTKPVGPFQTNKPGQAGRFVMVDFVFPGGLYAMDGSGNVAARSVSIKVTCEEINDAGNPTGYVFAPTFTYTANSATPQRFTERIDAAGVGSNKRFRVTCERMSDSDLKATTSDRVLWTGLKIQLGSPGHAVYGATTLLVMKLRATNGLSSDAVGSVRVRCKRRLVYDPFFLPLPTANPAAAFRDILCAKYGGNRPYTETEIDITALNEAQTKWDGLNGFNCVFDQPSTVWEALTLAVQCVFASPLPIASRMTIIYDGVKNTRAQMFTDENIAEGTLSLTYSFDRNGTPAGDRVEYRDPRTFSDAAVLVPVDAPDYNTISLFGCTSQTVAQQHATLAKKKRQLQRQQLSFVTELEGLNCLPGDRIGVQHTTPRWRTVGARVVSAAFPRLVLDRDLDWTIPGLWAILMRDQEGVPWLVNDVSRGATDNELIVNGAAAFPFTPIPLGSDREATFIAFGNTQRPVTDWIVQQMTPQGDTVRIDAINYDPQVYAGVADVLEVPS